MWTRLNKTDPPTPPPTPQPVRHPYRTILYYAVLSACENYSWKTYQSRSDQVFRNYCGRLTKFCTSVGSDLMGFFNLGVLTEIKGDLSYTHTRTQKTIRYILAFIYCQFTTVKANRGNVISGIFGPTHTLKEHTRVNNTLPCFQI